MPEQSSVAAVLIDQATEKEEMEIKEMFETLRAEMASRDQRTNEQFQALRAEMTSRDQHTSEQFQALRADIAGVEQRTTAAIAAAEQRTNERFQEVREDIKDIRQDIKDVRTETTAHVDKRVDDLRTEIQNVTIFRHSRIGLGIAALVGIAVIGTFVLQLLDAVF